MADIKVDRTTADRISAMIREGVRVDDIAEIENIPKRLVSVLEHSIALREGEGTKLERLMDLLKENTLLSQSNIELKEALQKPPLPSRMEQKCSVRLFLTTPECAVFLPMQ